MHDLQCNKGSSPGVRLPRLRVMGLDGRRIRHAHDELCRTIEVQIHLSGDSHPSQIALIKQHLDHGGGRGRQTERAVVRDTVFGFEPLDKVTKRLHRVGTREKVQGEQVTMHRGGRRKCQYEKSKAKNATDPGPCLTNNGSSGKGLRQWWQRDVETSGGARGR
ncbi:hypothetical protein BGW80DRAFT_1452202 [Lactifluus volemus]|nr:hypothetical protein BGW80DRAFT_1452202 [Lactifluus volemus]